MVFGVFCGFGLWLVGVGIGCVIDVEDVIECYLCYVVKVVIVWFDDLVVVVDCVYGVVLLVVLCVY